MGLSVTVAWSVEKSNGSGQFLFVCVRVCVRVCDLFCFVLFCGCGLVNWHFTTLLFRLSFREHYWYAKLSPSISCLTGLIVIETLFVRLEWHNKTRHSYSVRMNIASAESTICNLLGHVLDNFSMVLFTQFCHITFLPTLPNGFCKLHMQIFSSSKFWTRFRTDREEPNNILVSVWFPNGLASRCKSTQLCKMRTCEVWPNGFASRLASSRKSQKAVNFTNMQLVSTCVGEKLASLRANLS